MKWLRFFSRDSERHLVPADGSGSPGQPGASFVSGFVAPAQGAPMPPLLPAADPASLRTDFPSQESPEEPPVPAPQVRTLPLGLLDLPELRAFLDDHHFGLGRHNGSTFRTADARDQGVQSQVSRFQNVIAALCAKKQAQIDRLKDALLETEGVCEATSKRLRMACEKCARELDTLREQESLAVEGKGWVAQALDAYKLGFAKGLRDALDFESLTQ